MAAIERSRIRRTLVACALGSTLSVVCLGQTAGMPPLQPLKGTGTLAAPTNPDYFTFFVVGDDRPATETATTTPTIQAIFKTVATVKPVFVMMLGDTVYGKNDKDEKLVGQEYAAFLDLAASGGVPVYNAPGNHEMDDKHDDPSKTMEEWYQSFTGSLPYGAFNYGNSRFIALNTDDLGSGCAATAAPPPGAAGKKRASAKAAKSDKFEGDLSTDQLKALKDDLDNDGAFTHVFILMHRPIHAEKESSRLAKPCRDELEKLFKKHPNVDYVLASHEHLFYQPKAVPNTPTYLVSGGAGAPLATGGYYNYLVFTVAGAKVSWDVIKPSTAAPPGK